MLLEGLAKDCLPALAVYSDFSGDLSKSPIVSAMYDRPGKEEDYSRSKQSLKDKEAKWFLKIPYLSRKASRAGSFVATHAFPSKLIFLNGQIAVYTREMMQLARQEDRVTLLQTIPGIGPITASAIVATVGSGRQFNNGREFAA